MSIGGGIFLIAVGLILSFAVQDNIKGVDLTQIGYILAGAGVLVTVLGIIFNFRKRSSVSTQRTVRDPGTGESVNQVENSSNL